MRKFSTLTIGLRAPLKLTLKGLTVLTQTINSSNRFDTINNYKAELANNWGKNLLHQENW